MKNKLFKATAVSLMLVMAMPVQAQDEGLEAMFLDMIGTNAEMYLAPVVTAFGTGLNTGTFHRATPHKILGFDVKLSVAATMIPDEALTYNFYLPTGNIPFNFNYLGQNVPIDISFADIYQTDYQAPTFFGSLDAQELPVNTTAAHTLMVNAISSSTGIDAAIVEANAGALIDNAIADNIKPLWVPSGILDIPAFPTVMPSISIGLPFKTEVTFRGFTIPMGDTGDELSFVGYGAKISLNQFIPTIPIIFPSFSLGYYVTDVNMAEIIKMNSSILTLQASKSIPFITVYGGIGLESSKMTVDVNTPQGDDFFDFEIEGENSFRTIVGVRLKLLLLSINADYNVGEYETYSLGVGLTLR